MLDVGVTSDERYRESNYFEQMYPYPSNITCVGTEDGSHLARAVSRPELQAGAARRAAAVSRRRIRRRVQQRSARARGQPDAHRPRSCASCAASASPSSSRPRTAGFRSSITPACRCCTTCRRPCFVSLLRRTRYRHWAEESNLNILTARELATAVSGCTRPSKCVRFASSAWPPISSLSGEAAA